MKLWRLSRIFQRLSISTNTGFPSSSAISLTLFLIYVNDLINLTSLRLSYSLRACQHPFAFQLEKCRTPMFLSMSSRDMNSHQSTFCPIFNPSRVHRLFQDLNCIFSVRPFLPSMALKKKLIE